MAKMFYTLDEAASKLGKSEAQLKEMVARGELQEFRDRDRLMFKVEQVDLLAGGDDFIPLAESGEHDAIGLASSGTNLGEAKVYTAVPPSYEAKCTNVMAFLKNLQFTLDMENQVMGPILQKTKPNTAARDYLKSLDLLAALRARSDPARVLVFTMHGQPRRVSQALECGVNGYLLKDAGRDQLLLAIDAVARGEPFLQRELAEALRHARDEAPEVLSVREREVVERVALGDTSAQIAERLNLSSKTVDTYRSRLMAKLGVHDLANLVRVAVRLGVIDGDNG